jgi:hypothetical protein
MLQVLIAQVLALLAIVRLDGLTRAGFSGEDLLKADDEFPLASGARANWHHQAMTYDAAVRAGFRHEVATLLAWHADYVDSYAYNPLWWADVRRGGGIERAKVALATRGELAKLHFDDLVSLDQVRQVWRRYMGGTVAGLMWAVQRDDVSAARHLIGISLHALQDFYSHSNWVDAPERRDRTWFDVPQAERAHLTLWTGTYSLPDHLGVAPHGKFGPWCTLLSQAFMEPVMDVVCSGFSPLHNTSLCQHWRRCQEGKAVHPARIMGISIPKNVMYEAPPGIALDNTWTSEIGVQVRQVTDVSAADLFATTKGLALRTSESWLEMLGAALRAQGAGAFWDRVRSDEPAGGREHEFEHYDRLPYQFLTAGPYPPEPGGPADPYFLRVRLKTGSSPGAGTDADVYVHVDGTPFLLDYLSRQLLATAPRDSHQALAIASNDFEAGDDRVYTVGPLAARPATVSFENRAPGGAALLKSLGEAFKEQVRSVVEGARQLGLTLIAGHADFVASSHKVWSAEELGAIGADPVEFTLAARGGSEGEFEVHGTIRRTFAPPDGGDAGGGEDQWPAYEVRLQRLHCVEESDWDRFSDSDEPFVLAVLAPLPGEVQRYRTEPFDDVDKGEDREIGHSFAAVRVPPRYGMLSLGIAVWEYDDESSSDRDILLNEFAGEAERTSYQARLDFLANLGAVVATDWQLEHVEVYAFTRGGDGAVRGGTVLDRAARRWIGGGERVTFDLDQRELPAWPVPFLGPSSGP